MDKWTTSIKGGMDDEFLSICVRANMSKHNRERREQRKQQASYQQAALEAALRANLLPGRVYTLEILHDSDCLLPRGRGMCSCNPEIGTPRLVGIPEDN